MSEPHYGLHSGSPAPHVPLPPEGEIPQLAGPNIIKLTNHWAIPTSLRQATFLETTFLTTTELFRQPTILLYARQHHFLLCIPRGRSRRGSLELFPLPLDQFMHNPPRIRTG